MTIDQCAAVLFDPISDPQARTAAAFEVSLVDGERAMQMLVDASHDESFTPEILYAVGQALARQSSRGGTYDSVPLVDMMGPAYEGFDDEGARLERGQ